MLLKVALNTINQHKPESKSEYGITLNRRNYEVEVSGVCLFVRPYAVHFLQFQILMYHRMPSLQMLSSGVLKKCCLYLSRAIWNTGWSPLTSDWSKYFPLLLLNYCRWSHQTWQKRSSILCVTWTIFLKYGTYFLYAHSFPFSIENQIAYSIRR